ncbi:hypothetical protein DERP_002921 [Dermatophagoides pteronyssinus]|uniref:Uncharacterized protein n=2 Tax=Dermatophagoides pteronyssinus TaxID=6956 RepID=A0ABQ8JX19_DERPT|nr:uncharacterized protein LOC113793312 [Dermatophagoides pteronyssinus]KAH9426821.1 hypothetical protein DERP_002921 [Dermatophagoides pteronyssinus]
MLNSISKSNLHHRWIILAIIVGLITTLILLPSNAEAASSQRYRRQTDSSSTALATSSSSSTSNAMITLTNIILPTMRAIIQAPIRLLQELIVEIRLFLSSHNFSEMLDAKFLRTLLQRLPERIGHYWLTFVEMENECIQRTLCDVADFTTHHVPHWFKQIMLVYFTTFNQNVYFEAINNGLIAHNCQAKFSQCDPNSFLSRLSNNMSQSIHTTVEPIRVAFSELVNVTVSTLDSMSSTTEPSVLPEPLQPEANFIQDNADEFDQDSELNDRSGLISTQNVNDSQFDNVHNHDHSTHSMMQNQPIHPSVLSSNHHHNQQQPPQVPRPPPAGWVPAMSTNRQPPYHPQPVMIHSSQPVMTMQPQQHP